MVGRPTRFSMAMEAKQDALIVAWLDKLHVVDGGRCCRLEHSSPCAVGSSSICVF